MVANLTAEQQDIYAIGQEAKERQRQGQNPIDIKTDKRMLCNVCQSPDRFARDCAHGSRAVHLAEAHVGYEPPSKKSGRKGWTG